MDSNGRHTDISAFLASSVHDMKNSLSMLVVFLENELHELKEADFPAYEQMAQMLYQVKRVNANLIQFLAVYKIDNKFYPFDLAEYSVHEFGTEILDQGRPLMNPLGVDTEFDCPPELNWYFDRELVSGVVGNALNNAAHYTADKIRLAVKVKDGELEIRIEDNGRGYPEKILKARGAGNQGVDFGSGSTGLGLYFSSLAAGMHTNHGKKGSIRLENGGVFGGGCFILTLP